MGRTLYGAVGPRQPRGIGGSGAERIAQRAGVLGRPRPGQVAVAKTVEAPEPVPLEEVPTVAIDTVPELVRVAETDRRLTDEELASVGELALADT